MRIRPLSNYSNAFAYLGYKFPQMVDSFADIPVVELDHSQWDKFNLTGYGYLIRSSNISQTEDQLRSFPEEQLSQYRHMYPEMNRDLSIYDIYKKVHDTPFIIILEGNEAAIIHEVAHVIWHKLSPEEQSKIDLPEVLAPDNDQYLQSGDERFTHMTEMSYFKSQGMSFDDYFRTHNNREYQIINDPNADLKHKELAQMDYNDYKAIWDHAKTSSSNVNWLSKFAQVPGLTVTKSTHSKTGRPIYVLKGETYPIKGQLGRSGLGFNYWRPVGWWIYQERMTPEMGSSLRNLGFDVSIIGGEASQAPPAAAMPPADQSTQTTPEPPEAPATAIPEASTVVTDQSWDDVEPKSNWYGFPIKKNIYETSVPISVDDQSYDVKVELSRLFKKGRRRVPSYIYEVFWNENLIGRIAKPAPGDWGSYDEKEIASSIPEYIQERFAAGPKSKMFNAFKHFLELSGREPELTEYLNRFGKLTDSEKIDKTIHLDEPGYEGDFPVKFYAYSDGISWYGETALEHPQAPSPKTVYYIGDVPPSVHSINDFHQWLDSRINDPEVDARAKEEYLKYLKSFHYTEEEQEAARGQFQEILPVIESRSTDVNFFREKLIQHGYIRPSRRRGSRSVPGMQPQESIELILDKRKIVDDSYNFGKLSRSPDYFYTVLAYLMHRHKAGNIGFGSLFGQIGSSIRDFHDTLTKHGATISFGELESYLDSLAKQLLRDIVGVQAPGSSWDQYQQFYGGEGIGGDPAGPDAAIGSGHLDAFVEFAVMQGLSDDVVRSNPSKAYRTLAIRFHPDVNQNNPEAEALFKQLGSLWDVVPLEFKKTSDNWLSRICLGSIHTARWIRPDFEECRNYWDAHLEYNPLRGRQETGVGGMIAYLIEAAGDILREYSKDYRDPGYINEKINRLRYNLNRDVDFIGALSPNEIQWTKEIKSTLEGLPTPSPEIKHIKTLILQIINRELVEARLTQQTLHNQLRDQKLTFED